jgi:hypothetical protein
MSSAARSRLLCAFTSLALVVLTAIGTSAASITSNLDRTTWTVATAVSADEALDQIMAEDGMLRFDVAEDGTRFVWSGEPELVDGLPTGSTSFVTQGYIFPAGTLTDSNGVKADGSPEFLSKVLGQWSCWGWRLGPSDHTAAAPWLNTHLFNFGEQVGDVTLVSEGYSIDLFNVAVERVVSGGTGPFAGATGVQQETLLGFNASNGANFTYEVSVVEQ